MNGSGTRPPAEASAVALDELEASAATVESAGLDTATPVGRQRRKKRGGRAQVGLSAPMTAPAVGVTGPQALARANQTLQRVDGRIVHLLATTHAGDARELARLELAVLAQWRRTLQAQGEIAPGDTVLCEGLVAFADELDATLDALEKGGVAWARCVLEHIRFLILQARLQGTEVAAERQRVRALVAELEGLGRKRLPPSFTTSLAELHDHSWMLLGNDPGDSAWLDDLCHAEP